MANRFGDSEQTQAPGVSRFGDPVSRFGDPAVEAKADAVPGMEKLGGKPPGIPKIPKGSTGASYIEHPGSFGTTKGVMEELGRYGESRERVAQRVAGNELSILGTAAPGGPIAQGAATGVVGYLGDRIAQGDAPTFPGVAESAAIGAAIPVLGTVTGAVRGAFKPNARVASARVFRPTPSDPEFTSAAPDTLGAIKKANRGVAPTGITNGELDVIPAANRAIEEHQQFLGKWIDRAVKRGVRIPGDEIVNAVRESIPSLMWQKDPDAARALVNQAQATWGGQEFSIDQFRQFLKESNAGLSPFYNRAPSVQSAAMTAGTPTAIEKAEGDKVRELLYRYLDPEGNGEGPRLIQSKTGELIRVRDAAMKRNNSIVAEQPVTPIGALADKVKGMTSNVLPSFMVPPGWNKVATGISYAEGQQGRSLPMLKKAFRGADEPNALPLPLPDVEIPPSRRIGTSIRVPGVADTSGPTGRVPYMGNGVSPNVRPKALPPPSRVQSQGFAVGDDLVPIKDPATGKIVYVPKWTQQPPPLPPLE